jgi:hypothetical protein
MSGGGVVFCGIRTPGEIFDPAYLAEHVSVLYGCDSERGAGQFSLLRLGNDHYLQTTPKESEQ